jgi:hypothetical protein
VTRVGELEITLAVTNNWHNISSSILVTLMMEVLSSSKTSVLTRATQNTAFFIVTAAKTSNVTYENPVRIASVPEKIQSEQLLSFTSLNVFTVTNKSDHEEISLPGYNTV